MERDDDEYTPRRPRREDDEFAPRRRKSALGPVLIAVALVCVVLVALCGGGIYLGVSRMGETRDRMVSSNNLKQIALGMHNYESANGAFPSDSFDANGKPLLSWRVHILPYVEHDSLYKLFKLDEPWDSPNNLPLMNQMPKVYGGPNGRGPRTQTFYRGFTSPGAALAPVPKDPRDPVDPRQLVRVPKGISLMKMQDGSSQTILVLEAGDAIDWTKPGDLQMLPGQPLPSFGGLFPKLDRVNVALADASVRSVNKNLAESQWRAAITHSGNDVTNLD